MTRNRSASFSALLLSLAVPTGRADATSVPYPMAPDAWHAASLAAWSGSEPARIAFSRFEGFPNGTMRIDRGVAVSDAARFTDGTIDFDIKPLAYDYTGLVFRRRGDADGEFFYLRGDPDCPAADDCYQYAPIVHAMLQWNAYPNYQGPAQIAPLGWNHVHLVVSGAQMAVYLNHAAEPTLLVPKLQGLTRTGGIAFKGPAVYANLVIDPAMPVLHVAPAPHERGAITAWQAAAPTVLPAGAAVSAADIPKADAWHPIPAEPWGLVDLARAFSETPGAPPDTGWLRTSIDAASPGRRMLSLGWANQVSVFLDGRRVFAGENLYSPVERRLSPDGRLEADNASIPLDLVAGRHTLVLAVGNAQADQGGRLVATHEGWAAEAHLDPRGDRGRAGGAPAGG